MNWWTVCCLKVMHCESIAERSSALETGTTMRRYPRRVHSSTKAAGGMRHVMTPISTVSTIRQTATPHSGTMALHGIAGKEEGTRWNTLRWRLDRLSQGTRRLYLTELRKQVPSSLSTGTHKMRKCSPLNSSKGVWSSRLRSPAGPADKRFWCIWQVAITLHAILTV